MEASSSSSVPQVALPVPVSVSMSPSAHYIKELLENDLYVVGRPRNKRKPPAPPNPSQNPSQNQKQRQTQLTQKTQENHKENDSGNKDSGEKSQRKKTEEKGAKTTEKTENAQVKEKDSDKTKVGTAALSQDDVPRKRKVEGEAVGADADVDVEVEANSTIEEESKAEVDEAVVETTQESTTTTSIFNEEMLNTAASRLSLSDKLFDFQEIVDPVELTTESLEQKFFPVYPLKGEGQKIICTYASLMQVRPDVNSDTIMQSLVYVTEQEHGMIVNERNETLDEILVDMNYERDFMKDNRAEDEVVEEKENVFISDKNKTKKKNRRKYNYCRLTVDLPNSDVSEDSIYNRKRQEILRKSKKPFKNQVEKDEMMKAEEQAEEAKEERRLPEFDGGVYLNDNTHLYANDQFHEKLNGDAFGISRQWDHQEFENERTDHNSQKSTTKSDATKMSNSFVPESMDLMDLGNLQWEFTSIDIQLVIDRRTRLRYLLFRFIKKLPLKGLSHFEYKISRRKFLKQAELDLRVCKDQWEDHCKKRAVMLSVDVSNESNDRNENNGGDKGKNFIPFDDSARPNVYTKEQFIEKSDCLLSMSPPVSLFSAMADIRNEENLLRSERYGNMTRRKYLSPFYLAKKRPETRSYLEDVKRILFEDNISLHSISISSSSITNNNNHSKNYNFNMRNQIDSHYIYQIESLCKEKIELRLDSYTFALDNFIQEVELKCTELINFLETTFTEYDMYLPYLKPAKTLNEYNLDFNINMANNGSNLSTLFDCERDEELEKENSKKVAVKTVSTVGYSNLKETETFKNFVTSMISTITNNSYKNSDTLLQQIDTEMGRGADDDHSIYFILENVCRIDSMYYMYLVENEIELYARLKRKVQQVSDRLNQLQAYLKNSILMLRDSVNKATGSTMVQHYTKCLSVASNYERRKFEEHCRSKKKRKEVARRHQKQRSQGNKVEEKKENQKKEKKNLNENDNKSNDSEADSSEEEGEEEELPDVNFYTSDDYIDMPEILNIHDREIPISECRVFYNNNTRVSTLYLTYWHLIIVNKPTILSSVFPPFIRVLKFTDILNIDKAGNNGFSNLLINSKKVVLTVKKQKENANSSAQSDIDSSTKTEEENKQSNIFEDRYTEDIKRKKEAEEEITLVPVTKGDEIEATINLIKVLIFLHSKER